MNAADFALVLAPLLLLGCSSSNAGTATSTPDPVPTTTPDPVPTTTPDAGGAPPDAGDDAGVDPGIDPAYADVVFEGSMNSRALTALLAATPLEDVSKAAYFDNPKDLSEIPPTPITTFQWHDGPTQAAGTPAMPGEGYLLAFSTLDTGVPLFRVFTSNTSYTPDENAWAKVATGDWTTVQITSATFANDAITSSGGPYRGQHIAFCAGVWQ